jgi:hypothetical protein
MNGILLNNLSKDIGAKKQSKEVRERHSDTELNDMIPKIKIQNPDSVIPILFEKIVDKSTKVKISEGMLL